MTGSSCGKITLSTDGLIIIPVVQVWQHDWSPQACASFGPLAFDMDITTLDEADESFECYDIQKVLTQKAFFNRITRI